MAFEDQPKPAATVPKAVPTAVGPALAPKPIPTDKTQREPKAAEGQSKQTSPTKTSPAQKPEQRAGSRDEDWFLLFQKKKFAPEDVTNAVQKLHKAKKHFEVISLIEAALANGQSQPWMYDVLAMSMKVDGRSKEDIERVLLSRVDFTTTDIPNLLDSAIFLMALDGKAPAMRLCRQASELDPTLPQPYLMGLKLARDAKDHAAIEWASSGILMHTWTKDRERRHRDAEDAALEAIKQLEKAERTQEAARLKQSLAEALRRDLIVRIEWDGKGDLDLAVTEPFGTVCSAGEPLSAGGGVLVHDGFGTKSKDCFDEYVCVKGGSGSYRARISYVSGSVDANIVGKRCQLSITRHAGSPMQSVEKIFVKLEKTTQDVSFELKDGRRQQVGPAPTVEQAAKAPTRQELLAKLMTGNGNGIGIYGQFMGGNGGAGGQGIVQTQAVPGNGAVGYRPVIGLIQEGVTLTTSAVVSADRRYVRMALTPVFNTLLELATFSTGN